ncbi:MAG TPA: hypothetical protein VD978_08010 [Azospirillum sp.]|nr:hypothetical protein [Azospirillum sp.]
MRELMNDIRPLIEDCCGWNRRTWADAVAFAVSTLPKDLHNKSVLEIGAGKYSCIAPAFAAMGANVFCSYYRQPRHEIENGRLRYISEKYGIRNISLLEVDIHNVTGVYDIIVLKSVFGGICRGDDCGKMRTVVKGLMEHLADDGTILTMDNGYVGPFIKLSRMFGAGKHRWTYFKQEDIQNHLADYDIETRGFGFLNFGAARFMFRRDLEVLEVVNNAIHAVDTTLLRLFGLRQRAVLATVIRKKSAGKAPSMPAASSRVSPCAPLLSYRRRLKGSIE